MTYDASVERERYIAEYGSAIADLVFGVDPLEKAARGLEQAKLVLDSMLASGRIADYHIRPARMVVAFRMDRQGSVWFKYTVKTVGMDGRMYPSEFEEKAKTSRSHGPHVPRRKARKFAWGQLGTVEQIVILQSVKPVDHVNITFEVVPPTNDGSKEIPKEA